MTEPTTAVRLNAAQWAAMQAFTAGANATVEGVELAAMFAKPFEPAVDVYNERQVSGR